MHAEGIPAWLTIDVAGLAVEQVLHEAVARCADAILLGRAARVAHVALLRSLRGLSLGLHVLWLVLLLLRLVLLLQWLVLLLPWLVLLLLGLVLPLLGLLLPLVLAIHLRLGDKPPEAGPGHGPGLAGHIPLPLPPLRRGLGLGRGERTPRGGGLSPGLLPALAGPGAGPSVAFAALLRPPLLLLPFLEILLHSLLDVWPVGGRPPDLLHHDARQAGERVVLPKRNNECAEQLHDGLTVQGDAGVMLHRVPCAADCVVKPALGERLQVLQLLVRRQDATRLPLLHQQMAKRLVKGGPVGA
mmetsp:Transcript_93499/g.264431  ORF Transcript_93499/g.264431 Transcript_93499/m.264431 type:complete len:300 (+) Transcript_93499:107-1006(+)